MYYEYQTNQLLNKQIDPETPKNQLEPQFLGTIMYSFLSYLQVSESERLCQRNIKLKENPLGSLMDRALGQKQRPKENKKRKKFDSSDDSEEDHKQVPVGFDYSENFPSLPDSDGRGKKMRAIAERKQRIQAAEGQWWLPLLF